MQSKFQAVPKTIFSHIVMESVWKHGRILGGIMDPALRTFTITMPTVGVFLFGTAVCCFCCFKYGLQRWFEKTLIKTQTRSRTGITYAESLQYKKDQLESALHKVTKLRKVEPNRTDLKYEAVALTEGIRMLNEHLRNSEQYADYCENMKRPSGLQEGGLYNTGERFSFSDNAQPEPENIAFVNPMFSAQQAINSGYMIDPAKLKNSGRVGSPSSSSDEDCHNPKHKELELYLMSTGGTIRPSLLKFPESVAGPGTSPGSFPSGHVPRSRRGSPLGRPEIDTMGSPVAQSPNRNAQSFVPVQPDAPARMFNVQPNLGSVSSPSSPIVSPGGPNFSPNNTYRGSQPRVSP